MKFISSIFVLTMLTCLAPENLQADVKRNITEYELKIKQEQEKFKEWKEENVRRKHNFIPFIFNLLKELAGQGKLNAVVEKAQKESEARIAAAKKAAAKK